MTSSVGKRENKGKEKKDRSSKQRNERQKLEQQINSQYNEIITDGNIKQQKENITDEKKYRYKEALRERKTDKNITDEEKERQKGKKAAKEIKKQIKHIR
jgi:hypothetical protein